MHTLAIVGDRWTLLVIRDLFLGKRRFDEFRRSPEGIATNVLSERLARLENEGFVTRTQDPNDTRRVIYELSERGRSLRPVMNAVVRWGLANVEGTRVFSMETT